MVKREAVLQNYQVRARGLTFSPRAALCQAARCWATLCQLCCSTTAATSRQRCGGWPRGRGPGSCPHNVCHCRRLCSTSASMVGRPQRASTASFVKPSRRVTGAPHVEHVQTLQADENTVVVHVSLDVNCLKTSSLTEMKLLATNCRCCAVAIVGVVGSRAQNAGSVSGGGERLSLQ